MFKPIYYAIGMGLIWGSSFPISQIGVHAIGAFPFRLMTIIVSTLCLIIFSLRSIIKNLSLISKNDYLKLLLLCIPNIFIVPLINNIALSQISITTATILIYLMPSFTSIFAMFIARKTNITSILAIFLCFFGVLILSGMNSFGLGELMMVINAIIWALGAIISQRLSFKKIPLIVTINIQMLFTMALTIIATLFWFHLKNLSFQDAYYNILSDYKVIGSIIYIGTIGSALVYYLWFNLIKIESAEFTSYATLLSPVVSISIATVVFKEQINSLTFIGGLLILTSSFLVITKPFLIKAFSKRTTNITDD